MEQFIKSLSGNEREAFSDHIKRIKEMLQQLLTEEEDNLYKEIVHKSLQEVWDNEKDDAYNDL